MNTKKICYEKMKIKNYPISYIVLYRYYRNNSGFGGNHEDIHMSLITNLRLSSIWYTDLVVCETNLTQM